MNLEDTKHTEHTEHEVSYASYVAIWVGLLILTALTVATSQINLGTFNIVVALLIATVKSTIVLLFFMHLKYENKLLGGMVLFCFFTLVVLIGITYTDTLFR